MVANNKVLSIVIGAALILVTLFAIYKNYQVDTYKDRLNKVISQNDSLKLVRAGEYKKGVTVTDTKDLTEAAGKISKQLVKDVKKEKGKVVEVYSTQVVPKTVTVKDTVYVSKDNTSKIISFYPSKDSVFIKHTLNIKDNNSLSTWEFNPITLNTVVTENANGTITAHFIGPKWLTVKDAELKAINKDKKVKVNGVVGATSGYGLMNNNLVVSVVGGVKVNKYVYIVSANTDKVYSIGVLKVF